MEPDPTHPLKPRYEAFAQAVAKGRAADEAYAEAGFTRERGNASRLLSKAVIRARVDAIQEENNRLSQITRAEALAILSSIARTPPGALTNQSPLVQEYSDETSETGARRLRVKMPSKIEALKLIGKWCGWETGNQAEQRAANATEGLDSLIARIRSGRAGTASSHAKNPAGETAA